MREKSGAELNRFKSVVAACLTSSFLLQGAAVQAKTKVEIVSDNNYPPYTFVDGKKPAGIYVDVLNAVSAKMKDYEIVVKPQPWKRGLQQIEKGKAFAIVPPYHRYETRPYMWPYSVAIAEEGYSLICDKRGQAKIKDGASKWPEDYKGITLGFNLGFSIPDVEKIEKEKIMKLEAVKDNESNLKKLVAGRIDCIVNDMTSTLYTLKQMKESKKVADDFEITNVKVITRERGYVAYAADGKNFKYKDDFVKAFDTALYQVFSEGKIEEIFESYNYK